MTFFIKVLFAILIFLTIILPKLTIGLPVRSILLLALVGSLVIFHTRLVFAFLVRHQGMVVFLMAFGVLGLVLTLLHGESAGYALNELNRNILQVVLTLMCTYIMCEIAGPRFVLAVLLGVLAITGAVAIAQYAGIDYFWDLRLRLANIQNEPADFKAFLLHWRRSIGLSVTTMDLADQCITFLVAAYVTAQARVISTRNFNIIAMLILFVAITTGVRSLVIGCILTIALFNVRENRPSMVVMLLAAVFAGGIAIILANVGSRLANVNDASAVGRLVLMKYGTLLVLDAPFGYGWNFDTKKEAWIYWSHLMEFNRAAAVHTVGLHNYYLNFLVGYGVIGVLFIVLAALVDFALFVEIVLLFSGYLVNSFFHNGGPFSAGIYFWTAMAIFLFFRDQGLLDRPRKDNVNQRIPLSGRRFLQSPSR